VLVAFLVLPAALSATAAAAAVGFFAAVLASAR